MATLRNAARCAARARAYLSAPYRRHSFACFSVAKGAPRSLSESSGNESPESQDSTVSGATETDAGDPHEGAVPETRQPPWNVFFTRQYWREVRVFLYGMPNPPEYKGVKLQNYSMSEHRAVWQKTFQQYASSWKGFVGACASFRKNRSHRQLSCA